MINNKGLIYIITCILVCICNSKCILYIHSYIIIDNKKIILNQKFIYKKVTTNMTETLQNI